MKATLQFILPFIKKYPGPALLVFLMIMSIWGYYNLAGAIDKKADSKDVTDMQASLAKIQGELEGMAQFFRGKDSFNDDTITNPPPQYFVGEDSIWLMQKYDSCKCGFITDSIQTRPPWHCYYIDLDNNNKMKTFY